VKSFLYILKTILYGWVGAAKEFFAILCKLYRRWRSREGKGRVVATSNCVPIYNPAFVKPDPLIYDQYYLTSLGLAVTWDNPDIQLYLNGAPVSSSLLAPGTTYEVVAQIWNNSTDCPAVAMPVSFSFLEFGISTVGVPIGSTQVNLGVKGGPGCPAYATMPWTTPITPGHYCIQVQLQPFADINFQNNLGQENTNVGTASSPAVFTFPLRNGTRRTQTYNFEVDAYIPLAPEPCGAGPNDAKAREARLAKSHRGLFPVPAGWHIAITPNAPTLLPNQSVPITVSATPPSGFTGSQVLNVHAFHAGGIAGGVTLTVNVL
jgi:hypothetical protein